MPSSSRRSGTAHTSKGKSQQNGMQHIGESSSSHLQEQEEQTQQSDDIAAQVEEMLHRLEHNAEPLTIDGSDTSLKSLRSDWAPMEANFTIAYEVITQVAERLAEERAAEGIVDEDDVRGHNMMSENS